MSRSFKFSYFFIFLFLCNQINAQKVGVVLSGGGARGLAHIGVLKALEENHIPIDYITGTSMGAIIASFYAIGYSPEQIEDIVKGKEFENWSKGNVDYKYANYFRKTENNASWIRYSFSLDSTKIFNGIPTNVISPIPMDFGMMELAAGPSAAANYNFDSLFIPFRCVAADIAAKEAVIFKSGDLAQAVRASMSYPFYIKPITIDGKLLFDGGLYNNFAADVMYKDFYPDYIIGSNVAGNLKTPDEDDLLSQIKNMFQSKTNYQIPCEAGIIIEPETNIGLFEFSKTNSMIDSGYVATLRQMNFIKQYVTTSVDSASLVAKRKHFLDKHPPVTFDNIIIEGLNKKQSNYVRKILGNKNTIISMGEMKQGYYRLSSDNKIKTIFPKAIYNPLTKHYDLYLRIRKEKDIVTYFGGNFSNRPISSGYIGVQYNYLGSFAAAIMANAYFGKLYSSVQFKTRFDFPFKTPLFIEPSFCWNKFDYFKSSNNFFEDQKPPYLIQSEAYGNVDIGIPISRKSKIVTGGGYAFLQNKYYQTNQFSQQDTADKTIFDVVNAQIYYEINSLNRKQYANAGEYFNLKVKYVNGFEKNVPGSTSFISDSSEFLNFHEWVVIKLTAERYFNRKGSFKFALFGEGVYSAQTLFNNHTSSLLTAQTFQPTPDSKTLFLENYRTHKYLAGGIKFIQNLPKNLEFRVEAYLFQPYQMLIPNAVYKTDYGKPFAIQHYIGTGALVWQSPVGPMSISVNYYDKTKNPFSILFHFGYILFNKRALD